MTKIKQKVLRKRNLRRCLDHRVEVSRIIKENLNQLKKKVNLLYKLIKLLKRVFLFKHISVFNQKLRRNVRQIQL